MNPTDKIYNAGNRGLVGSALMNRLQNPPSPGGGDGGERKTSPYTYTNRLTRTHAELDLTRQAQVDALFAQEKPDYVFLAGARVGGIRYIEPAPCHPRLSIGRTTPWEAVRSEPVEP